MNTIFYCRINNRFILGLLLLCMIGYGQEPVFAINSLKSSNNHLKYFGFAGVDCGLRDPHIGSGKTDFADELSGFANIGQMCVYSPKDSIGKRVALFHHYGLKAVLDVEALLFDRKSVTTRSRTELTLRHDAEKRWSAFANLNKAALVPKYLAAIYIADEPAWNNMSLADFKRALKIVKKSLPDIPTMSIEAWKAIDHIMVPKELDWIGFDRYDSVDPAHDQKWLADLKAVTSARTRHGQKIVIVASTQWLPYYQKDANVRPEDMGRIAESYYHVAESQPGVIALVGYLWPGGLDGPSQLGARDLPRNVQQILRKIGEQIILKR